MSLPHQAFKPITLVVEDDPFIQENTQTVLNECGFDVDFAGSSEEALILVKKNQYNVILMNIGLPGKDGAVTTREIRQWEQNNRKTPSLIIALTTRLDLERQNYCLSMGMDDFFEKPIQKNQLLSLIKRYPEMLAYAPNVSKIPGTSHTDKPHAININAVVKQSNNDKEKAMSKIKKLVKTLESMEQALEKQFQQHEKKGFISLIHKLIRKTAFIGPTQLNEIAKLIEKSSADKSLDDLTPLYKKLLLEIEFMRHMKY